MKLINKHIMHLKTYSIQERVISFEMALLLCCIDRVDNVIKIGLPIILTVPVIVVTYLLFRLFQPSLRH